MQFYAVQAQSEKNSEGGVICFLDGDRGFFTFFRWEKGSKQVSGRGKSKGTSPPLHYTFKKQKVRILLPKIKKYVHNDAIVEHECENTIAKDTDLCEVITLLVEQVKPTRT